MFQPHFALGTARPRNVAVVKSKILHCFQHAKVQIKNKRICFVLLIFFSPSLSDICSNVGGIANAECPGGDPAGCLGFSFHVPNTPYMPPFGTNATDWLKTNRFLFEPWSAQIKSQTFIGPPIGDKPCPTSF